MTQLSYLQSLTLKCRYLYQLNLTGSDYSFLMNRQNLIGLSFVDRQLCKSWSNTSKRLHLTACQNSVMFAFLQQYFQSFFRCFTCLKWFHFQQRKSSRIKQTFTGHFDLLRKLYVLNRETNLLSLSKTIHLVYSFPSVSAYICFSIYKQFFPAIRKD